MASKPNYQTLTKEESAALELLVECGQGHLFKGWPVDGVDDEKKKAFCEHILTLDKQVAGGLVGYVERAKKLLADSRADVNPYDGFKPTVPHGVSLDTRTFPDGLNEFHRLEAIGVREAAKTAFTMVAGGLGERLGYNGIKIALPSEITTETTYIELYIESILALQTRARKETGDDSIILPLAIMTSGDTDAKTRQLLSSNRNFGMPEGQLTIVKQELVPAMSNNDAHFVLDENDPFRLNLKPHGHGDVHTLLYQYGLSKKWAEEGRKWVVFFQDTNGVVFRAIPAALAVSAEHKMVVNSLTVPRRPGEAVGAIVKLESEQRSLTINVEYNQLDALMKSSGVKDEVDASGFSKYPGNINVLVFDLQSYAKELEKSKGVISEFVNPKYKDKEKTTFNKPTRLECMMQDYPKLLAPDANVGFTQIERWTSFSAVKNNLKDAVDKQKSTGYAESGASGEADIYYANRKALSFAGVEIQVDGDTRDFSGVKVNVGARVVLAPSFACTLAEVQSKIKGHVRISNKSTLVIRGSGVLLGDLDLDGTLVVEAVEGASITLKGKVHNEGWDFSPILPNEKNVDEKYLIRGYVLERKQQVHIVLAEAGEYELTEKLEVRKIKGASSTKPSKGSSKGNSKDSSKDSSKGNSKDSSKGSSKGSGSKKNEASSSSSSSSDKPFLATAQDTDKRLAALAKILSTWKDIPNGAQLQKEVERLQKLNQTLQQQFRTTNSGDIRAAPPPSGAKCEWVRKAVSAAERIANDAPARSQKPGWPGAHHLTSAVELLEEWESSGRSFKNKQELAAAVAEVEDQGEARALAAILAEL